jgi:LPXTG-motif cell wall-anchored protein
VLLLCKRFVWIVMLLLVIGLMLTSVSAESGDFSGGNGTSDNPYQISTAEQLNKVRNYLDKHFILVADIDLGVAPYNTGLGWEPIGINTAGNRFVGVFDGGGYTVSNLYINRATNFVGLFGWIQGYGTIIRNVRLEEVNVTGGDYVGGLAGVSYTSADISDSYVDGSVTGNQYVGGLVGHTNQSWTKSVQAVVNVYGVQSVGGLIGYTSSSEIYDSYALGNVSGTIDVGGLIGYAYWHTAIARNYSGGSVSGDRNTGGLVGRLSDSAYTTDNSHIKDSFSISTVQGNDYVGGLVGQSCRLIERTYAVGIVSGNDNVGGLVGDGPDDQVNNSFWDTETTLQSGSSGGVGKNKTQMQDQDTFTGWNFDTVWGINPAENGGYPFLRWQGFEHIVPTVFAGGTGTELDPYQIATAEQLNKVRNYLDNHFILIADIDLDFAPYNTANGWEPIGTSADPFTGSFDGDGHIINNLYIDRLEDDYVGLFGYLGSVDDSAFIQRVGLVNVNVKGKEFVGGLAGFVGHESVISNTSVTGNVDGNDMGIGGLVGWLNNSTILDSHADSTVTGYRYVGGLVGWALGSFDISAIISNSSATGDVTATQNVGGLVGVAQNWSEISNSHATGNVTATTVWGRTGGLVGTLDSFSSINESYAEGDVIAVSGTSGAGGLVGGGEYSSISNSYASGTVEASQRVGGLVGQAGNSYQITNSYAIGTVSGDRYVGGLVGDHEFAGITNCYATGEVTGSTDVGGLVGSDNPTTTISGSYYNSQTTGQTDTGKGEPKTTVQMQDQSTFDDYWDFDAVWGINPEENGGYPFLRWQGFNHVVLSDDADLAHLVSSVSFNESFDPSTTEYLATVSNSTDNITITPVLSDSSATLTVNGFAHDSGTAKTVSLVVGSNTITIEVTAADGLTIKVYSINVTRQAAVSSGGGSYSPPEEPEVEEDETVEEVEEEEPAEPVEQTESEEPKEEEDSQEDGVLPQTGGNPFVLSVGLMLSALGLLLRKKQAMQ